MSNPPPLEYYDCPPALSWCAKAVYFARLLTEVVEGGKELKRAVCVTKDKLYVCDKKSAVLRLLDIKKIEAVQTQFVEVRRGVLSAKTQELFLLFKIPSEKDLLLALTPDKANGNEGNENDRLLTTILAIAKHLDHTISVSELPDHEPIGEKANFVAAEGYVETRDYIEQTRKEKEKTENEDDDEVIQVGSPSSETPLQPTQNTSVPDPTSTTVVALSARVRQLEEENKQLLAKTVAPANIADLQAENAKLKKQLESEQASREDMVQDLRADFDTKFIKKQAAEFELRNRSHQRVVEKHLERIKVLEAEVNQPKTYSGGAEHLQRINTLETKVSQLESALDESQCRAIHFENAADEIHARSKDLWDFIQDGCMPRIRDLQAGKDPKTLPFLPTKPQAPQQPPSFVYDASNKPVRTTHVDAAVTDGDLDLDLDGPAPAADAAPRKDDVDLDLDLGLDDLDLPDSKPANTAQLDDDLDLL
eukprot:TRINITY_DN4569_c0_g1_i1.p1 TRINITY_DN4569_c0_g1~~TRINITY_DN4569_c0_g1_i1.p1  ORF type:complete len:478 (+),score=106.04 TRINITY_DN4569_c0_g1_i1:49-1482(+)